MRLSLVFILLTVYASFTASAADSSPRITAARVAGNIYIIEGSEDHRTLVSGEWDDFSGGNIGLSVGKDGVLIVDAKYATFSAKVREAIRSVGGDAPRFIIDTHHHDDHSNANSALGDSGIVIAHSKARIRMMTEQPEESWPVITFDDTLSVHLNGEEIEVLHYPNGHTDGDAIIHFTESNVVHMGDLYFNGYLPYTDLESGGNVEGYMQNIARILDMLDEDVKIIPGHGPVATKKDLENYYRLFKETIDLITGQMKSGKTLAEIQATGLPKEWAEWAWGMASVKKYIEIVHRSYSKD